MFPPLRQHFDFLFINLLTCWFTCLKMKLQYCLLDVKCQTIILIDYSLFCFNQIFNNESNFFGFVIVVTLRNTLLRTKNNGNFGIEIDIHFGQKYHNTKDWDTTSQRYKRLENIRRPMVINDVKYIGINVDDLTFVNSVPISMFSWINLTKRTL